jgi:hypothetical protein
LLRSYEPGAIRLDQVISDAGIGSVEDATPKRVVVFNWPIKPTAHAAERGVQAKKAISGALRLKWARRPISIRG